MPDEIPPAYRLGQTVMQKPGVVLGSSNVLRATATVQAMPVENYSKRGQTNQIYYS